MSANAQHTSGTSAEYDVEAIRKQFPILETRVRNAPLTFLDSAASAQNDRSICARSICAVANPMPSEQRATTCPQGSATRLCP